MDQKEECGILRRLSLSHSYPLLRPVNTPLAIMFLKTLFLSFVLILSASANKNTQVGNNHLNGDQNVGGIHFFEFHAPNGGSGLGVKILIVAVIAIAVAYWCIKQRIKKCYQKATSAFQVIPRDQLAIPMAGMHGMPKVRAEIAPTHTYSSARRVGPLEEEQ